MKTNPNCKINLGLKVLRRRPDGYHDLATVFLPVPLCDELEIAPLFPCPHDPGTDNGTTPAPTPCGQVRFSQSGIAIDCPAEQNICVKAYNLLLADFPTMPSVQMHLTKNIPFGAGLGGGSSDAAFALKMLNELFSLGITDSQLKGYAARLGADCAFFIDNVPAYATGIGDRLTPLAHNPVEGMTLLLAKPDEAVSTREAYAGLHLSVTDPEAYELCIAQSPLCQALDQPVETWRQTIANDFEATVLPPHPAIANLKQLFYAHGARYACMSGSGATVFALFDNTSPLPTSLLDELRHRQIFFFMK